MLVALVTILLGLLLGVGLAWLVLSGVMALAFHRARTLLRRIAQRRHGDRPGAPDRRHVERRTQ